MVCLGLFVGSCEKNEQVEVDAPLSIESAKSWFESSIDNKNARTTSDENSKNAVWDKATYHDFGFGKVVVIPIKNAKPLYLGFSEKGVKKESKYKISTDELSYLVVSKDNSFKAQVVKLIPTEKYLDKSNGRKKKVAYEGLLILQDWNGNFIKGMKYENGRVVATVNDNKKARSVTDWECETTDWYTCASWDGGNSWSCHYTHSETNCTNTGSGGGAPWEDQWTDPDYNGGGSSGGPSNGGNSFENNVLAVTLGTKPIAVFANKCGGAADLWQRSVSTGKEVNGVLTTDGHFFLVTQVSGPSGGPFDGLTKYTEQLTGITTAYYVYPANDDPMPTYTGTIFSTGKYYIPISATIHSHTPCISDGTDGITNNYSSDDDATANFLPMINHFVVGCGAVGQYSATSNGYFNINSGNLNQTCNNIQ